MATELPPEAERLYVQEVISQVQGGRSSIAPMELTRQTLNMMKHTGLRFAQSGAGYAVVAVEKPTFRGPLAPSQSEAFTEWYWRGWAFRR